MKNFLYITHLSGKRVNRIWMSAILAARELGFQVHIVCNMDEIEPTGWQYDCEKYGLISHHIDFCRNPLSSRNIKAYRQLNSLMKTIEFDIVHCNTPIGGVIGRICSRVLKNSKVIYQAHGFHFWKGAPLKNWLLYYPVERFLAHFTDRLITINHEDYKRAQSFHYKKGGKAEYVPGVGIDIERFKRDENVRNEIRTSLGIRDNETVLLSVGEINANKNQKIVIEALAKLGRKDIRYVVCGVGNNQQENEELAKSLGLDKQIMFVGFRTDIDKFYMAADVFVVSSFREGLPVAPMEAMAAGLPCVASRIRGNVDLFGEGKLMFDPYDANSAYVALVNAMNEDIQKEEIERNKNTLQRFSMCEAVDAIKKIYADIMSIEN